MRKDTEVCKQQGARPAALITGGSRGVGAATADALAERGYDVLITYRNKAARAQGVVDAVQRHGVRALAVACDMTQQAERELLIAAVQQWSSPLGLVILNASGGLERDLLAADPDYPLRINRDAQVALFEALCPLLLPGASVVFVTSHWAHRYGEVEQLPAYTPIAASKHAGERALRQRQEMLTTRGLRLLVVTGDMIEGTITAKLLERAAPGLTAHQRHAHGTLPTTTEMGQAIAQAALDPHLPSGSTVVVGRALGSLEPRRDVPQA